MAGDKCSLEKKLDETKSKNDHLHQEGELIVQNVNQLVKEHK